MIFLAIIRHGFGPVKVTLTSEIRKDLTSKSNTIKFDP